VQKNKFLSDDIVFLCRSLGYKTTIKEYTAKMKRSDGSVYTCVVYSIMFSQEGELPLLVERKKSLPLSKFKDRRLTGITIEKDVVDDYYGFELDGDHLFLLSDFTVTHNTSKTTLASITALSMLHNGDANRMTLIRPTVATENIGFLKGSMEDKMGPWFTPVIENLYDIYERKLIDKYFQEGQLRFLPLQFAQGVNFKNEVVIFEEAENATEIQIRMALTRLCDGAKLIFTGDVAQIQLKNQRESGFAKLIEVCSKVEGMAAFELTENRRAKIVQEILNHY
jgi:predicted ribonuclease YlaK